MESPYHGGAGAPASHSAGSRPLLGFPLGTALVLVVIFTLSGLFSCCYHWDKLRRSFPHLAAAAADGDLASFPKPSHKEKKKQSLPVIIMPGDDVPKFIAVPCPCEPPRSDEIVIEMRRPPPKPPRAVYEFSCSTSRNMVN
ncbi:hypothetical protein Sango_0083600 [Sesamum angolense]|uniref:Hydroxyproline-rich glycoprotein family protein n=1 Tax=Sesamum angolense TaxID=2727404 RepID=A0AAE2C5U0_9LAMI|nr:hypothetical protein Sango_0083600 [Sesamum angolense]